MGVVMDWVGDDLHNLLTLPNVQLYKLYSPYLTTENIRRIKNAKRKLYKEGKIKMPERENLFSPETEPDFIEQRRSTTKTNLAKQALQTTTLVIPIDHLDYHKKLQEALSNEGRVEKAVFREGSHTGFIKNADGEIEYTDPMPSKRVAFAVTFDTEPKWPLITRVESVKLPKKESLKAPGDAKKAVVLPDLQIPYHDEKAIEVALKLLRDVKPDKVIFLGDLLDLESFSSFTNIPLAKEFATSTQGAIDYAHTLLETVRRMLPRAEIVVLEGNHDVRLSTATVKNNMAAFGLRKANQPESWPVVSVPFLCSFDDLDIEYVSGYPANRYWINENLQVVHGNKVRSAGSTARLVSDDERVTTIFGHVHRLESQYKTHHTYRGGRTNAAHSIGCLCRLDGAVPSRNRGVDLRGKPVENFENWQQGLAVIDYYDGNAPFTISPLFINTFNNYQMVYNGRTYATL